MVIDLYARRGNWGAYRLNSLGQSCPYDGDQPAESETGTADLAWYGVLDVNNPGFVGASSTSGDRPN